MAQNRVKKDILELNKGLPNLPNEATRKATASSRAERWRTVTARFFCKNHEDPPRQRKAEKHAWKPFTLCAPLLMSISVVAVSLIAIIQILHNRSQRDGGIILAEDLDSIPFSLFFTYQHLPTIIAVGLSIVWGWVDLDTKRLEPYFQLSKPEGAIAEDSILLDYPFDLLPVAPFRAAKRRHWAVVCAGTAMMITFWAITPLQSGIFATDTTTRSLSTTMIQSKQLLPSPLNHKFMISAYGISWLGERVPPFTTREYALEPFEPRTPNTSIGFNQNWTSKTTLYSLDLSCHPASFTIIDEFTASWSTQEDCTTQGPLWGVRPQSDSNFAFYAGTFIYPNIPWHPNNSSCLSWEASSFFVVWVKNSSTTITNATALFCRPSFYLQEVNVTVSATDLSDSKLEPSGLRQGLPDTTFNTTDFRYIISTSDLHPQDGDVMERDMLEQGPRLVNMNFSAPLPRVVEFAVAATQMAPEWYSDPNNLMTGYRLLFSLAVNSLMTDVRLENRQSPGTLSYQINAVVVVPVFAVIVQAALGLLAALAMSLLYISWSRTSQLSGNPNSICSVAALVRDSPDLLKLFENCDALDGKRLNVVLLGDTVRFRLTSGPGLKQKTVISNTATRRVHVNGHNAPESVSANPVRLVAMDPWVAAGFILTLLLSIAALAFCSMRIRQWNGLPRLSQNDVVRQLLTAYLPTAFATALEVFWVFLDRLFCVIQPFKEFKKGRATAKSSVKARYTSLPPQLVFLHALRARHFLLAVVCGTANLANLLSIALGGLFREQLVCVEHEKLFTQSMTPSIQGPIQENFSTYGGNNFDHFYIARANLSDGTPLPPWVSTKQFFVPFEIEVDQDFENNNTYNAMTQGFETELTCHRLHEFEGAGTVKFGYRIDDKELLHIYYTTEDGRMINCHLPLLDVSYVPSNGPATFEYLSRAKELRRDLLNITGLPQEPFCYTLLVASWLRADTAVTGYVNIPHTKSQTVIACEQKMKVAPFYVMVDAAGHVQESAVMGPLEYHTNIDFLDFLTNGSETNGWHSDTLAMDWPSYLLNILANSSLLTDPRAPAPDPDRAINLLTDLYQRVVAIVLGLHTHALIPAPKNVTIVGSRISHEYRIFMDPTMFWISITILSLDLIVAVSYYYHMRDHFLPRMPTSIASVVGFMYASRALQTDFRDSSAATKAQRFGYGRFIGVDGKAHIGIERHPFVVPMDCGIPKPPFRKRVTRKLRRSWLSRMMGLAPEGEEETWI